MRIAFVVVGLAVCAYGAADVTGGWLGEPPWNSIRLGPGPGHKWITAAFISAGLLLLLIGARPRRHPTEDVASDVFR